MLDESQAEIKIARKNINNLRYAGDNHFNGRNRRGTKEFFMRVKEKSEKADFKLNIKKKN